MKGTRNGYFYPVSFGRGTSEILDDVYSKM